MKKDNMKTSIICLLIIFVLSVLSKWVLLDTIWYKIWPDELLYNDIARSIAQSGTIKFANMYGPNTSYLYSYLLSLVFLFYKYETITVSTRVFGIVLMSTTVFPVFLLAKKLEYNNKSSLIFALTSILVPDMLQSLYTVTEVIAYPIFMWTMYFFYSSLKERKFDINIVLFAVFSYLSYQAKSLNLALVVGYCLYAFVICYNFMKNRDFIEFKSAIKKLAIYLFVFAGLYVLIPKILIFAGALTNDSNIQVTDGWSNLINGIFNDFFYTFVNWGSAFVLYMFYILFCFGFFTIIIPITHKYEKDEDCKFVLFLNLLLLSFIGVVILLVHGVEEPLDYEQHNVHLRYLFYFFIPYLMMLYKVKMNELKWNKYMIGALGFVIIYVLCGRYIHSIANTYGVKSMFISILLRAKRFLEIHPQGESFFNILTLLFVLIMILIIHEKGWENFLKKCFPILIALMLVTNSISYYFDIRYVTVAGNLGHYERNEGVAKFINQYDSGEIILVANNMQVDNEIQTLQLMLEKCIDRITYEELDAGIKTQNGKFDFHHFNRTPYLYAKEEGRILEDAKYIVFWKYMFKENYVIENNIAFEDDFYIIYELNDGNFIVSSEYNGITSDNWIGEEAQIVFYPNEEQLDNNKLHVSLAFNKDINPNEHIDVNIDNGYQFESCKFGEEGLYMDTFVNKNEYGQFVLKFEIPNEYIFNPENDADTKLGCKVAYAY